MGSTVDAARALLERYVSSVDDGDVDAIVELFTPDGVLDVPAGPMVGHDRIRGFYGGRVGAPSRHLISNANFTLAGNDQVSATCSFVALLSSGGEQRLAWGTYTDDVEVLAGVGRFRRRRITMDGQGPCQEVWMDAIGARGVTR